MKIVELYLRNEQTWPIKNAEERRLEGAEMGMLRRMCGVTREDKTRNDYIRGTVKVVEVSKKVRGKKTVSVWSCHAKGRRQRV